MCIFVVFHGYSLVFMRVTTFVCISVFFHVYFCLYLRVFLWIFVFYVHMCLCISVYVHMYFCLFVYICVCIPRVVTEFVFNEAIVSQLAEMGFALEGCKRAVFHTKNSGVEQAMEWVMQHMADPGKYNHRFR